MKVVYEVTIETKTNEGDTLISKYLFENQEEANKYLSMVEEQYKKQKYMFLPRNPALLETDPIFCQYKDDKDSVYTVIRTKQCMYSTADEVMEATR